MAEREITALNFVIHEHHEPIEHPSYDEEGSEHEYPSLGCFATHPIPIPAIFDDSVSGFAGTELGRHSLHSQRLRNM